MLKFEEAWDYNEYLISSLKEYHVKQSKIYDKISLDPDVINKIKELRINTNIIVFAEIHCPDSRVVIPILEKMRLENDKINLYIFPRTGNEKYMELHTENSKMPSIMIEDIGLGEDELVLIYEEFLPSFKKTVESSEADKKEDLIYQYRTGSHNNEIQHFLIDEILKITR
jgi:hypothetical protein